MPRTWACGRFELSLDHPIVMGILNVTPDSFSDGGEHADPHEAVTWAHRMVADGAGIVDVGGESTRPGSAEVSVAEELVRVRPVIAAIATGESVPVSIDTRHAEVASAAVEAGADIVNDVSGFRDSAMVDLVAHSDVGVVIMHMLGEPGTMQSDPRYDNVVEDVAAYLARQADMLVDAGVAPERIAIDPGIGFGKTLEHNLALLRGIPTLAELGYTVLVGASRKRFIGELTGEATARDRVGGSIAAALEAVARGAHVVRVHDVAASVQALQVAEAIGGTQ